MSNNKIIEDQLSNLQEENMYLRKILIDILERFNAPDPEAALNDLANVPTLVFNLHLTDCLENCE